MAVTKQVTADTTDVTDIVNAACASAPHVKMWILTVVRTKLLGYIPNSILRIIYEVIATEEKKSAPRQGTIPLYLATTGGLAYGGFRLS